MSCAQLISPPPPTGTGPPAASRRPKAARKSASWSSASDSPTGPFSAGGGGEVLERRVSQKYCRLEEGGWLGKRAARWKKEAGRPDKLLPNHWINSGGMGWGPGFEREKRTRRWNPSSPMGWGTFGTKKDAAHANAPPGLGLAPDKNPQ